MVFFSDFSFLLHCGVCNDASAVQAVIIWFLCEGFKWTYDGLQSHMKMMIVRPLLKLTHIQQTGIHTDVTHEAFFGNLIYRIHSMNCCIGCQKTAKLQNVARSKDSTGSQPC